VLCDTAALDLGDLQYPMDSTEIAYTAAFHLLSLEKTGI